MLVARTCADVHRPGMHQHGTACIIFLWYYHVEKTLMNLVGAVANAQDVEMERNENAVGFGEDFKFGGVFRASVGLADKYGEHRVFNTPLCEQGIAGFAIGLAAQGKTVFAEIQFADYIFPAFDQIVNEAAKYRYRSGGQFDCGGLVFRSPGGAVGHGGHYHSQSPESLFCHVPGLKVVVPRTPAEAKGLLLASVASGDPVVFFEPKVLYRHAEELVPVGHYTLPLGKARTIRQGSDVTVVAWGTQANVAYQAAELVEAEDNISVEVIDLRTLLPWDRESVEESVKATGRMIVTHEAPITGGYGGEIASSITERCFLHLKAPVQRVCGFDTPFPLSLEKLYLPGVERVAEAIRETVKY